MYYDYVAIQLYQHLHCTSPPPPPARAATSSLLQKSPAQSDSESSSDDSSDPAELISALLSSSLPLGRLRSWLPLACCRDLVAVRAGGVGAGGGVVHA